MNKLPKQRIRSTGGPLTAGLRKLWLWKLWNMDHEASREARNRVQHTDTEDRETQTI